MALHQQEYLNLLETFEHGEAVLHVRGDEKEADTFYLLAFQKGEILKHEMQQVNHQKAKQERERVAIEEARVEKERLMLVAAEEDAKLREQEMRAAALKSRAKLPSVKIEIYREPGQPQVSSYTVRRGETLPQIAARTEIYNDSSLWPLIYRSNRDQIRDPKQLWPGQVLKIPRQYTREEALEAKRYSGKK